MKSDIKTRKQISFDLDTNNLKNKHILLTNNY